MRRSFSVKPNDTVSLATLYVRAHGMPLDKQPLAQSWGPESPRARRTEKLFGVNWAFSLCVVLTSIPDFRGLRARAACT
jgi:hypothetical protein